MLKHKTRLKEQKIGKEKEKNISFFMNNRAANAIMKLGPVNLCPKFKYSLGKRLKCYEEVEEFFKDFGNLTRNTGRSRICLNVNQGEFRFTGECKICISSYILERRVCYFL